MSDCLLCQGEAGDRELGRIEVWSDERWRLTTSVAPEDVTAGFSFLEPRRHIPHITELDGEEARTLGAVLARCTAALKEATGADLVYIYVFGGGIPHLHLHLAPHRQGDALNESLIRGEVEERSHPSGATVVISKDFPPVPLERLREVAEQTRKLLGD